VKIKRQDGFLPAAKRFRRLGLLTKGYEQAAQELQAQPELAAAAGFFKPALARLYFNVVSPKNAAVSAPLRAVWLAESIADVEYATRTHEVFKAFQQWLRFHIVLSLILYFLLALHIFSELWFGLRWFP
jgi:hypothetical protein